MQYDLVFEGGGAKGTIFVGAMQAFEAEGHTVGRLLGTSAGAITATLLAAGYTAAEMLDAMGERRGEHSVFTSFMGAPGPVSPAEARGSAIRAALRQLDLPLLPDGVEDRVDDQLTSWVATNPSLRHLYSFVEQGGWYSADAFLDWMRSRLDSGAFRGAPRVLGHLTLAGYHAATGVDLSLVASDITGGEMLILNHQTAPELPVVWAVRMSMGIPLLWQEVIWRAEWGRYRGREMVGHAIVDGGLLSNFPLELLVSRERAVAAVMGERTSAGVVGLLLDEALPIGELPPPPEGFSVGSLRVVRRISRLVDTALGARDRLVVDAFEPLVARLPAGGVATTEFDMSDERRASLIAAGRCAMEEHLVRMARVAMSFSVGPSDVEVRAESAADRMATRFLAERR